MIADCSTCGRRCRLFAPSSRQCARCVVAAVTSNEADDARQRRRARVEGVECDDESTEPMERASEALIGPDAGRSYRSSWKR